MSRPDLQTSTEADAGRYDRMTAYPDPDARDRDEPGIAPTHDCTSPNPERCLVCVLDEAIAAQKADAAMFAKERAAVDAANRAEWWEGA